GRGSVDVPVDTVAGEVILRLQFDNSELVNTTIRNVASYFIQKLVLDVAGIGTVQAEVGYGGLAYSFVDAQDLGFSTLLLSEMSDKEQTRLIEVGSAIWTAAQESDAQVP